MSPLQEMSASFDRLVYMVKTTAPHLQSYTDDLRAKIKACLNQAPEEAPPVPVQEPAEVSHETPKEAENVVPENVAG